MTHSAPACGNLTHNLRFRRLQYLGLLFGLWYAANILFNIWNKQVLKAYNFPITGTFVQFGIGLLIASAMWLLRLKAPPKARARPLSPPVGPASSSSIAEQNFRVPEKHNSSRPQVDKDVLIGVLPLAVVHTLGNLLTNISLGAVSVSFTHTIKARARRRLLPRLWLCAGRCGAR